MTNQRGRNGWAENVCTVDTMGAVKTWFGGSGVQKIIVARGGVIVFGIGEGGGGRDL